MSVSSLRIAGSVVVLSSLLLLPITAWAQAEDEPFRGIAARGDKKWGEVAEEMRKAIAINPTSTRKVQMRARIIFGAPRIPSAFLSWRCAQEPGNCAAAVAEWETSEDQKVILGVQQALADLRAGYKVRGQGRVASRRLPATTDVDRTVLQRRREQL